MRQYLRAGGVLVALLGSGALSYAASPNGPCGSQPSYIYQHATPGLSRSLTALVPTGPQWPRVIAGDTVVASIGDSVFVAFFISGDTAQAKVFRGGATYKACGVRMLSARFYSDHALTHMIGNYQMPVSVCPPSAPVDPFAKSQCRSFDSAFAARGFRSDTTVDPALLPLGCDTTKAPPL